MLEPVWHKQLKRIVYMKEPEEILVTKITKETAKELKGQSNEFKAAHVVMTPEQIYDYMHEEHTPYASMTAEEGKAHIVGLIERYTNSLTKDWELHGEKRCGKCDGVIE